MTIQISKHSFPAGFDCSPSNSNQKFIRYQHQTSVIKACKNSRRTGIRCHVKTPLDPSDISQSHQAKGFGTINKDRDGENAGAVDSVDWGSLSDDEIDFEDTEDLSANGGGESIDVQDIINGQVDEPNFETITGTFPYKLDQFQKKAISTLLEGKSAMVCAPTGAGKTAIAEAAAMLCLCNKKRIIYTTPLKALSNQKLAEFQERFGDNKVGLVTGDMSMQQNAPIVVMTTEILRNIMYSDEEDAMDRLRDVAMIVLDEVHYLGDPDRGTVWEEVIAGCPRAIRMLCMSATVANPGELGSWISLIHGPCKTVKTKLRPVPLKWFFARAEDGATKISPLFDKGLSINPKVQLRTKRWRDVLKRVPTTRGLADALEEEDLLPAIVFTFNRKACDRNVLDLRQGGFKFTSKIESDMIRKAIEELKSEQPEAVRSTLVKPLMYGIASHHAGCLPGWKSLIEKLFQDGLVKIVFATETLAAGINMPARTTVITTPSKGSRSTGKIPLTHNQLLQMAGRAGRRGYDTIGNCVICHSTFNTPDEVVNTITKGPEPLASQFKSGYSLVLNLLSRYSLSEAEEFCKRSFRNYLAQGVLREHEKDIELIKKNTVPLQEKAQRMEKKGEGLRADGEKKQRDIQESLFAATKALKSELETRVAKVQELLDSNSLPKIIEINRIASLEHGSNAVTNPVLAFDTCNDSQQDWIVCLGVDNHLRRITFDKVATVYTNSMEDDTELKHLHARNFEVEKEGLWKRYGDHEWTIKGNIWTAKLSKKLLNTVKGRQSLEQAPGWEEQWSRVKEHADRQNELIAEKHTLLRKFKKLNKEEARVSRRLRSVAKELRRAKRMTDNISASANVNWKEFQDKLTVLKTAGAINNEEENDILPLGKVARDLHGKNELWLAIAVTHPATTMLSSYEMAGFIATLVAYECISKPDIFTKYSAPERIFEIMADLEITLKNLESWEWEVDIDSQITMDARLSGLVTAWAQGCTWEEIMDGTSLEDGDIARLLTRTIDLLQQVSQCRQVVDSVRSAARTAFHDMNRAPIAESF